MIMEYWYQIHVHQHLSTNINTHLDIHLIYYTNIFPMVHLELDLIRPSATNLMQLINMTIRLLHVSKLQTTIT